MSVQGDKVNGESKFDVVKRAVDPDGNALCPFCNGTVDPTGVLNGDGSRSPECNDCGATTLTLDIWNGAPALAAGLAVIERSSTLVLKQLRQLLGYVEDGSDTVLSLFQDDATRSYCLNLKIAGRDVHSSYSSDSMVGAIQAAHKGEVSE